MNGRWKKILGWVVILTISFMPIALLSLFGPGENFSDYSSITHTLGEIAGLVGITMFALTFILSTRIKPIEDVFGGLDKVYIVHGVLGGTALIVILAHPILLVLKFIPAQIKTAATYLLPTGYWSVDFGIIAIICMIILIFITLFTKMKYHHWKFTHEFLGLVFLFAILHMFLVRGDASKDYIFSGYYIYATIVSAIGLGAFSYSLLIKDRIIKNAIYKIDNIVHNKELFTLEIVPEHKPLNYQAGQFIFIRFYNEKLSKEAHPFSIASKSDKDKLKIIIKSLGDFTSRLEHLKPGDKVSVEGPYGRFNFRNYENKQQIWIAAGIGITPFVGMVEDLEEHSHYEREVDLYFSANNDSDFVGYDFFLDAAKKIKNFKFIPWNSTTNGRLNIESIKKLSGELKDKEILICGPTGFKESIIHNLIKEGVKEYNIHEEMFDFR